MLDSTWPVMRLRGEPLSVQAMDGSDWSSLATTYTYPAQPRPSHSLAAGSGRNSMVGADVSVGGGGGGEEPWTMPHAASLRGGLPSRKYWSVRSVRSAQRFGSPSSPVSKFTGLVVTTTHWPSGEHEGSDMMLQSPTW